jgi:hypothetical protein
MSIARTLALSFLALSLAACVVRTRPAPGTRAAERRNDVRDAQVEAMTGWDKLGERWINGGADRDVIHVGRDDGRFTRVKLKAEHSALELFDVQVVFADGTSFSPGTRLVFGQGSWSRDIDLPGGARAIRRVEFRYGNLPGGGRAQLELWAR